MKRTGPGLGECRGGRVGTINLSGGKGYRMGGPDSWSPSRIFHMKYLNLEGWEGDNERQAGV
jgi:hypothetical protein